MSEMALFAIEIMAIAVVYSAFSALLQRKYLYNERMRGIRKNMGEKQKQLMALAKSDPNSPELSKRQKELMDIMGATMKDQMKPMIIALPLFFALYYVVLPMVSAGNTSYIFNVLSFSLSYQTFFIVAIFALGLAFSIAGMLYDKIKDSKKAKMASSVPE